MNPFYNAHWVMDVTIRLASVSVLINALEFLIKPAIIQDHSIMSWSVFNLRHRLFVNTIIERLNSLWLPYKTFRWLILLRLIAAAYLLIPYHDGFAHIALIYIALTSLAILLRSSFGMEGSDQTTLIMFVTLAIIYRSTNIWIQQIGFAFLTLQLCLSYLTAGVYKIISPLWWSGSALINVLNTEGYGHKKFSSFLRKYKRLTRQLSRAFILWECSFPLVLLLPFPSSTIFLSAGLVFHLSCAYFMGLNNFFWSFIAYYPVLIYTSLQLPAVLL